MADSKTCHHRVVYSHDVAWTATNAIILLNAVCASCGEDLNDKQLAVIDFKYDIDYNVYIADRGIE